LPHQCMQFNLQYNYVTNDYLTQTEGMLFYYDSPYEYTPRTENDVAKVHALAAASVEQTGIEGGAARKKVIRGFRVVL
jgi:hypothetical protein